MTYPIMPALHGFSIHKRPTFATGVQTARSGREVTNFQQRLPLWEFELTYEILRDQTQNQTPDGYFAGVIELQKIMGLFAACAGEFGLFYFEDLSDNSRTSQALGTGNGVETDFRLLRTISYFNQSYTEPVGGINLDHSVVVYLDDVATPELGNWSISADLRYLIFVTPPGAGVEIRISYYYRYLCRFISNDVEFEEFQWDRWLQKGLRFRSVNVWPAGAGAEDVPYSPFKDPLTPPLTPPLPPGPSETPDGKIWLYGPSFGTAIGAPYVSNLWGSQRSDVDTGFPSGMFTFVGSSRVEIPLTGKFLVRMKTYFTKFIVTTYHIDSCYMRIVFGNSRIGPVEIGSAGDITDTNVAVTLETSQLSVEFTAIDPLMPITAHMEIKATGTTGLGGGNIFPSANETNTATPFHPLDASFIVEWWDE